MVKKRTKVRVVRSIVACKEYYSYISIFKGYIVRSIIREGAGNLKTIKLVSAPLLSGFRSQFRLFILIDLFKYKLY